MLRIFTQFILTFSLILSVNSVYAFYSNPDPEIETSESEDDITLEDELEKTMYGGNAKVFKLEHDDDEYGHAVWIYRKGGKLKSKYFASGSVYNNYSNWKHDKHIFLACSGAFTNNNTPVGLTVDNGQIVNRLLEDDMDGLVIVYATGGVVVSDIDKGDLYLDALKKKVNLRESMDKRAVLEWAAKEEATLFQTQLLVYKNELRLEVDRARTETAERRILVLAKTKKDGVIHIIFNIDKGVYLGDITDAILKYLKEKDSTMDIIGMLNLDTGSYNIMEVYDDHKKRLDEPEGKENIGKATNLLIYHYEK